MSKVLILPGDGIGVEVTEQAVRVLSKIIDTESLNIDIDYASFGGAAIDQYSMPLPSDTLEMAKSADTILLGAVGGPKWDKIDPDIRPEKGLLAIRKELGLYANLRPATVFSSLAGSSALKPELVDGLDILTVRELTGGLYFGEPREYLQDKAYNTMIYHRYEIDRIARVAFEAARARSIARGDSTGRVCSVDKANVLEVSRLWRDIVIDISKDYPDIELSHMYVDNAAMQLVSRPKSFDVILTENLFGDILSDAAGMLTGSLGMLPSASLGNKNALFEPIHGSAPDIAGKSIANPIAAILSVGMMMELTFSRPDLNTRIKQSIEKTLSDGIYTPDIAPRGSTAVTTYEITDAVISRL